MRDYELMVVLSPELDEEGVDGSDRTRRDADQQPRRRGRRFPEVGSAAAGVPDRQASRWVLHGGEAEADAGGR